METLDNFNAKIFSEQLHTKFHAHVGNPEPLEMELVEVNERTTSPQVELFSLTFRGPVTPVLVQHIHHLEHDKLGKFDLFLTPVGRDENGTVYEAIFHRLKKPQ